MYLYLSTLMDKERLVNFAHNSTAVMVVEEKRPVMEDQIARHLYSVSADRRPALATHWRRSGVWIPGSA
jgi:indolepyruvate ferredoxin oxidoreductase